MPCQVVAESWSQTVADWLIVGVLETATWDGALAALDHALQGQLTRLQELGDLTGKAGESVVVRSPVGIAAKRLLLIGLGKPEAVTTASLNRAYSIAGRQITSKPQQTVAVGLPAIPQPDPGETARLITTALLVAGQGQDLYRTEKLRFPLADIRLLTFMLSIPPHMLACNQISRTFFRNATSKLIPDAVRLRHDKTINVLIFGYYRNFILLQELKKAWEHKTISENDFIFQHLINFDKIRKTLNYKREDLIEQPSLLSNFLNVLQLSSTQTR